MATLCIWNCLKLTNYMRLEELESLNESESLFMRIWCLNSRLFLPMFIMSLELFPHCAYLMKNDTKSIKSVDRFPAGWAGEGGKMIKKRKNEEEVKQKLLSKSLFPAMRGNEMNSILRYIFIKLIVLNIIYLLPNRINHHIDSVITLHLVQQSASPKHTSEKQIVEVNAILSCCQFNNWSYLVIRKK